jgi:hypothetical protein
MVGEIVDVPGTRDVTLDLQKRTFVKASDRFLMVNQETKELQYVTADQIQGSSNMMRADSVGAVGDDIHDDTIAIQNGINECALQGLPFYLHKPAVRWVIDRIVVPAGVTIVTDGYDTVVRHLPQSLADRRAIEIRGSNVKLGDFKFYGNISTDINEQNHAVYIRAQTESYENIEIGNIWGLNIRGDVLYIGARSPYNVNIVKVGNIYGSNILRNIVSVTGGSNIDIQSIDGDKVGSLAFDVEPEPTYAPVDNVHIGFIRGRGANLAAASAINPISNVRVDKMVLSPSIQAQSEPAYYPELATGHGMVVRNLYSANIGYLEAYGFSKCAIFTIINPGEIGCKSLRIDSVNIHDCSLIDAQYNSFIQGSGGSIEIGSGVINVTGQKSGISGFEKVKISSLTSNLGSANDLLIKGVDKVDLNLLDVTGSGTMLRFVTKGGDVRNTKHAGTYAATACNNLLFSNLEASVSADVFDAQNRNHQVIASTVNGVPYAFGIDNPLVNSIGALDAKPASVNGFTIGNDNKLYPQSASATRPGLLSAVLQVISGVKRFMTTLVASAGIARGTTFEHALTASANNDVIVGAYFGSNLNSGGFTGVKTYQIQAIGTSQLNSDNTGKVFFGSERGFQFGTGFELRGSGAIWNPASSSFGLRLGFDATSNVPSLQGYRESVGVTDILLQATGGNVGIGVSVATDKLHVSGNIRATGLINLGQFTTATRPVYSKGAQFFDTTLSKLVVGGASAWEVVTSA